MDIATLKAQVAAHDQAVEKAGLKIWLGCEPTFTDRFAETSEWLSEALGEDKESRARQLVKLLSDERPGALLLRTVGRRYAGEACPRWSYGLYRRRDGQPVWSGAPDLLSTTPDVSTGHSAAAERLHGQLCSGLLQAGWLASVVAPSDDGRLRLVFRMDGTAPNADAKSEPRLHRQSVYEAEEQAVVDDLAGAGEHLLVVGGSGAEGSNADEVALDLPGFASVEHFLTFLDILGEATRKADTPALRIGGFPPPVDDTIAWTTLTPDPAVLEINLAPAPDIKSFWERNERLFDSAARVGLSPFRLSYDGTQSDSGGGGQITFGGPSPAQSPFFVHPQLLPRLVRYLVAHPALSYWFATRYVGGSSQSPRPDENTREALVELGIALETLQGTPDVGPELLWSTLRHFLADGSGNPHRSELNIEKLQNAFLPGRGCLGLVEFRAFRMARGPEHLAGLALLLRSILCMLCQHNRVAELARWGDTLHDRFALPTLLRSDLQEVLSDLDATGWGVGKDATELLLAADERLIGTLQLEGATLRVEHALEFWPLVGDVASQESGGSRLVDASTARIELKLTIAAAAASQPGAWRVVINGHEVPLRAIPTPKDSGEAAVRLLGVRYRAFVPAVGLHPTLPAVRRVEVRLEHLPSGQALRAQLHSWKPDGGAYDGLPASPADAAARRAERFVVESVAVAALPAPSQPRAAALTEYCLDLRRV